MHDDLEGIEIDRELVNKGGLYEFVKCAWHEIEPGPFVDNWHIPVVCEHLEYVSVGDIRNLLILLPPSCMKSLLVATFWPVWDWIEIPSDKFIFSSYGQSLSNKNAKQHRDLIKSEWFRARWGDRVELAKDSLKQIKMFENTAGGFRFSTSVGGEITGRHGNRLVFDDLVKVQDADGRVVITEKSAIQKANDFWFKTVATRESDPKTTSRVGIMQRIHTEDAAAKCIKSGDYEVLCLPMEFEPKRKCVTSIGFEDPRKEDGELLWPDHHDQASIEKKKGPEGGMGPNTYAAQMQQRPVQAGGVIFKVDYFQHWLEGQLPKFQLIIQSWDMSFKKAEANDLVCGTVWGMHQADFYLLDCVWKRMGFNDTLAAMRATYKKWPLARKKLIEEAANGNAVKETLEREIPGIVLVKPEGGKEARANAVEPYWASHNIWLPPVNDNYPWVPAFKAEHTAFPLGLHDDAVDSGTQAVLYLEKKTHRKYVSAMNKLRGKKVAA